MNLHLEILLVSYLNQYIVSIDKTCPGNTPICVLHVTSTPIQATAKSLKVTTNLFQAKSGIHMVIVLLH